MLAESEYRNLLQKIYDRVEKAFEDVDPDVAECEQSLGSLTIRFGDGSRCILSAQPSVRQLWVAIASRGRAHHFNYDATGGKWIDDKDSKLELLAFLAKYFQEMAGGREFRL